MGSNPSSRRAHVAKGPALHTPYRQHFGTPLVAALGVRQHPHAEWNDREHFARRPPRNAKVRARLGEGGILSHRTPIGLRDVVLTPVSRSWNPAGSVFRCGQDRGIDQRPLPSGCGQQAPIRSEIVWHAANRQRSGTGCLRGLEQKATETPGCFPPASESTFCHDVQNYDKGVRSWRF